MLRLAHRARGPEHNSSVSSKFYRFTGDRISPAPWFAIHDFEGAEPNYVNALAFLKVELDDIKQQVDQTQRLAICQAAVT